ncbi:hypothetical protein LI90_678 [Carbonactinospora thermoautotrophica]|uniref:WXG100 family type VII secretion target n=1 Tax=Carbonactinospora thermoautotrophica TaxID=1469144 RepID=A0A132MMG2_9ACTN|nr:hypothetical protein [Carbonactinospora thermoautotrophica]KWW99046.1 hypothetical protein LI90_678 [Carbonactinospora thermoautotrophica]
MSDRFEISPESLRAASRGMRRCAEDFAAAVERLRGRVLGAGSPWGGDEFGTLFGTAYTGCTELGLRALDHLAGQLGDVAEALGRMGANTQGTDEANAAGFRRLEGGVR